MSVVKSIGVAVLVPGSLVWCLGCSDETDQRRDVPLREGIAREVSLSDVVAGKMQVEYRSSQSVKECLRIQAEVRELWDSYLKSEAERSGAVEVFIWPEDESRTARSYKYSRANDRVRARVRAWEEDSGFLNCE